MNVFTIRDLENLSGIKVHTIRMWEQRYHFLHPKRTTSNIRYYDCEELKKVLNVALLIRCGFRISQISQMSTAQMHDKVLSATDAWASRERVITALIQAMVEVDTPRFEQILTASVDKKGIEKSVRNILFPFLEKANVLWTTNHINAAQERLVTNFIRQKLVAAIDSLAVPSTQPAKVLLFLPEGEWHELGLLYVHYLLRSRGIATLYLGANIPVTDVALLCNQQQVNCLCVYLASVTHNFHISHFIGEITEQFSVVPVILAGNMAQRLKDPYLPKNIHLLPSFAEILRFARGL